MGSETQSGKLQLPLVDFTNEDTKPGTETWVSACQVVRSALEDHGGFLAIYDKVSPELDNSVYSVMEQLFDLLSAEAKKEITADKKFHGYVGNLPHLPLYESLGVDSPLSIEAVQNYSRTIWPSGNDKFCESANSYAKLVKELEDTVMRMVFESYGLERQKCDSLLESMEDSLRSYKYREPQMDETNLGIVPHTDATFISILHQKETGLEIKLKDGNWFEVDNSPSSFLVIAGDVLTVWSNGRISPGVHRVVMKSRKTRYSTGLISHITKIVQPEEELIDDEHPRRYKTLEHFDYLAYVFTEEGHKYFGRPRIDSYFLSQAHTVT
ncbi:hypothetical protein L6164_017840 [Bauhinia variegata]|uniref:Uncharacterized protein n=1 Tax=Bauhinia variegata TaxID=167791 RepID=A0ACB9N951_BAUVA|nr:hypothetical protein L6164_017840 [Bauhinia variegata]